MRLASGRCAVGVLVVILVITMIWLHMSLLAESQTVDNNGYPSAAERSVMEKTSDSLADIMHAIQSGVHGQNVAPGVGFVVPSISLPVQEAPAAELPPGPQPAANVAAPAIAVTIPVRNVKAKPGPPPRILAKSNDVELSDNYQKTFDNHISRNFPSNIPLDGYMKRLSKSRQCQGKPIFITMARVKSDLYWQLIENYFFTMYRFGHTDCAVMICISDQTCVDRCRENGFPCFDYRHDNATEPIFLQIGKLKLYYVGEAIKKGVDVMLLDLDVSFLRDPLELMNGFLENETEHIRCQMDLIYSMNTDENGNQFWFSHPGPNFGLFLAKSSEITKKVFKEAWNRYEKVPFFKKNRVATDQNVIGGAMSSTQWRMGRRFVAYFYIGADSDQNKKAIVRREFLTPLLDKIEYYSPDHIRFELGATAAREELKNSIAVHATCYEGSTKLLALKAVNAFWDIRYYNPLERTITKPLMTVTTVQDLRMEIRALAYLALKSNRSLIIPNILIGVGSGIRGKDRTRSICKNTAKITCNPNLPELDDAWATDSGLNSQSRRLNFLNASIGATNKYQRYNQELQNKKISGQNWTAKLASSNNFEHRILTESKPKSKGRKPKRQGGIWDPNVLYHEQLHTAKHQGERYWPAFRTIHNTRSDLKVLEPGFYYRIEVDFKKSVPEPFLLNIDVSSKSVLLDDILSSVLSHDSEPRLVLDLKDDKDAHSFAGRGRPRDMMAWAKDPLSSWGDAVIDKRGYLLMPQFKDNNLGAYRKFDILETVYICPEFLRREYGNRACFNKCT